MTIEIDSSRPSTPVPSKKELQRQAKVKAGLDELERWLQDLMHQGLASDPVQSYKFWDDIAARMVDAQAPGLARRLRDCAGIPHADLGEKEWPERLLSALGKIHLLVQGYRRIHTLPPPLQSEIKAQIGWPQKKADLLALAKSTPSSTFQPQGVNSPTVTPSSGTPSSITAPAVTGQTAPVQSVTLQADEWLVLGTRILEEEKLWTQRVWLWGMKSDRPALILNYAYGRPDFTGTGNGDNAPNIDLVPGIILPAELVFYPSSYPLRALVRQMTGMVKPLLNFDLGVTVKDAIAQYGRALGQNPWLDRIPMVLNAAIPVQLEAKGYIMDPVAGAATNQAHQIGLPLHPLFPGMWELLALSGGHPVAIAAEWDGHYFWPLSVAVDGRLVLF